MVNSSQFARLQKMQDLAVKLINSTMNVKIIYSNHKIAKLKRILVLEQQKFAYHLINNLLPANLSTLAKTDHKGITLCKTHNYNTRTKAEPNLPSTKSHHYQNSFLHQSVKAFSTLPLEVKQKKHSLCIP